MMTEWTEEWVRGAAGWKPFKEGKALQAAGRVTEFKRRENICQGLIKEGRLSLRPIVKVVSKTDIQVQCGCVENRATGAVCAHAVAVLLSAIPSAKAVAALPPTPTAARSAVPASPPPPKTSAPAVAWEVKFSPRYVDELASGRLTVRLIECSAPIDAADRTISGWLPYADGRKQHALQISGPLLASFLDSATGHPRITCDGNEQPVSIQEDPAPALDLQDSRLEAGKVYLRISAISGRVFDWGGVPAVIEAGQIAKLPVSINNLKWVESVHHLIQSGHSAVPVEQFLADYDAWSDLFQTPAVGWLGNLKLSHEPPKFLLSLDGSLDTLWATLMVEYPGAKAVPLPPLDEKIPGLPRLIHEDTLSSRQIDAEKQAMRRLRILGFDMQEGRGQFRIQDEDRISAFLADDLRTLSADWEISTSPRLNQSLRGLKVIRPVVEKTGDYGTSLSFELSFQTNDGTRIPSQEIRRLLGASKRGNSSKAGIKLLLSRDCEELIAPLISEFEIGRPDEQFTLSGPAAFAFDNIRKFLSKSKSSSDLNEEEFQIKTNGIHATLRSYQTHGASWLVERLKAFGGALLADEMGLGKTLQTIAAINHFKQNATFGTSPALVLVPTSLVGNWQSEIKRFAPELNAVILHGSGRDRHRASAEKADVVITSYGTLVRDLAFHLQREYSLVAADEASVLRNATTDIAKSLYKLKARARLALTGTPVENRIRDLWSVFRFIAPGYLGTQAEFQERYEAPASQEVPRGALQRLRLRISPFVLRRTKEEVASDLPEKIEIDEWLPLDPGQAKLYAGLARAGLAEIDRLREKQGESAGRMHLLTLLLRLRQICVDPALIQSAVASSEEAEIAGLGQESLTDKGAQKSIESSVKIDRLLELLESKFEDGGKTLVFSQFASNLRNIRTKLKADFGAVFLLDGSTRNRGELVTQFQETQGPAVFLISIKAGGYGLNLTAADTVIHMDPWWNPAVEAQATDRAHRIGQTKSVTVYRLLTKDTVEERVRRMQDHKRAIINATTGNGEEPANWTMDDLEGLLR
jgi:SNF2 family DNA or RNA helicase